MKGLRSHSLTFGSRGYAILVLVNLLVLVVVLALSAAYYFYRLSAGQAEEVFAEGDVLEKSGEFLNAEDAYREAARLDPLNAHYRRRLHQLEFRQSHEWATQEAEEGMGKGGLRENVEAEAEAEAEALVESGGKPLRKSGVDGGKKDDIDVRVKKGALPAIPVAASAALWPEPGPEEEPGEVGRGAMGAVDEETPGQGADEIEKLDGEVTDGGVRLRVVVPEAVTYRIEAVAVEGVEKGAVVEDWRGGSQVLSSPWESGRYVILARAGELTPWRQEFEVPETGEAVEGNELVLEFGLLKILGEPLKATVYQGEGGKRIGSTPYTLVRPPAELDLILKAGGYEDEELSVELLAGEAKELNPVLKKTVAPSKPEKAKEIVSTSQEDTLRPRPTRPARPVEGQAFMNGDGSILEFRSRSSKGDPFWRSEGRPLAGMSDGEVADYCRSINERERVAGRIPFGYAYFPSLGNDGRMVLARDYAVAASRPGLRTVGDAAGTVVARAEPIVDGGRVGASGVRLGSPFTNGAGMPMEYRQADYRGNPYWRSAGAALATMSEEQSARYLWELTAQEREAGRLPAGYAYARELGDSGRYVLVRKSTTEVKVLR